MSCKKVVLASPSACANRGEQFPRAATGNTGVLIVRGVALLPAAELLPLGVTQEEWREACVNVCELLLLAIIIRFSWRWETCCPKGKILVQDENNETIFIGLYVF